MCRLRIRGVGKGLTSLGAVSRSCALEGHGGKWGRGDGRSGQRRSVSSNVFFILSKPCVSCDCKCIRLFAVKHRGSYSEEMRVV